MKKQSAGWRNFRYGRKPERLLKPLTKAEWDARFGAWEKQRWEEEERRRAEALRRQGGGTHVPQGGAPLDNTWQGD